MFIESLESRIAPSGVVHIDYTAKSLTLKDTIGEDSTLTITGLPSGAITITPDAETRLIVGGSELGLGVPFTAPVFFGAINAALGGGADSLTLQGEFPGAVKADLGGGKNELKFDTASILGAFTLKGGADADDVTFGGTNIFANSVAVNLGNGENYVYGGAGLTVGKNLTLQGGAGFSAMNLTFNDVTVGGNIVFTGVGSSNQFGISVAGSLHVGGSIAVTSVAPSDGESAFFLSSVGDISIGGNVSFKSSDTDHVVLNLSAFGSFHIGGGVKIDTGKLAGVNAVTIHADDTLFIGKAVAMTTSNQMRPTIYGSSAAAPSWIGGGLTIKGGSFASITLDGTIAGKVNIALDGNHPVASTLSSATPEGRLRLLGAASISTTGAGSGTTLVDNVFAYSSVTIKDAGGARTVAVQDSLIIGALTIDTGAGVDLVRLEATGDPGSLFLFGPLTVKTGAGLDNIILGGNDPGTGVTTIGNKILIDGGPDFADYSVGLASIIDGNPVVKNVNVN